MELPCQDISNIKYSNTQIPKYSLLVKSMTLPAWLLFADQAEDMSHTQTHMYAQDGRDEK